ncbi:MAG: hypothetical protein ACREB9_00285 [Thermoplasmata archaeon]
MKASTAAAIAALIAAGGVGLYFAGTALAKSLTATISGPSAVAVGGTAAFTIAASGGTAPYTYSFGSSLEGAQSGDTYTVTPTATGTEAIYCTVRDSAGNSTVTNTIAYQVTPTGVSCPLPDVPANSNGTCPADYVPDSANPGCCEPSTPPPTTPVFELNGNTGSVIVQCGTDQQLIFTGSGFTPNAAVWLAWGNNPDQFYIAYGNASNMTVADDFGGVSLTSCVFDLIDVWQVVQDCAGNALTNPFYLALYDAGSGKLSYVLTATLNNTELTSPCKPCGTPNLIPGSGTGCAPGTSPCTGVNQYRICAVR